MKKKKVMNQIIINIVNHIKNKQINNVMKKSLGLLVNVCYLKHNELFFVVTIIVYCG